MMRSCVLLVLSCFFPGVRADNDFSAVAREQPDDPGSPFAAGDNHFASLGDSVYQSWVARYNGPDNGYDDPTAVAVDGSGNVYVAGLSGGDIATIKYNLSGQELWVARYDGAGSSGDWANALAVDNSGNVYVTGYCSGSGAASDYATIKYNAAGQEQWVARYNGPGDYYDEANAVAVDDSGNVYVTGYSFGFGTAGDYATIKYDASGQELWVARYDGPSSTYDEGIDLVIDGMGNVYVTGYSPGAGTGADYATIMYNPFGQEQWVARYDGPGSGHDYGYDIALGVSGDIYAAGTSGSDYATVKYDASGQQQWVARYDGGFTDYGAALAVDGSDNVYVTGYSSDINTAEDYATLKYDSSGQEQWVARYDGPGNSTDQATALATDASGSVYVTGLSSGSGTGYDYATIKYDASGLEQWVVRYDAVGLDDRGTALAIDGAGDIYVAGLSLGSGTGYDFATIQYQDKPSSIAGSGGWGIPKEHSLRQNYPNPFNPETEIRFEISDFAFVKLSVYDLLGREVAILVNERLSPGVYARRWNGTGMPSGVYYYRLEAGDFLQTRKLLLLR